MKLPLDIQFHEDVRLLVWKPHGVLNEAALKHIMTLLEGIEASSNEPFNRFTDGQALDAIDLNFRYVFDFALFRRLSAAPRPAVKSAVYVATSASTHYVKLHSMLTDYSPLHWLCSQIAPPRQGGSAFRSRRCRNKSRGKSCLQT